MSLFSTLAEIALAAAHIADRENENKWPERILDLRRRHRDLKALFDSDRANYSDVELDAVESELRLIATTITAKLGSSNVAAQSH